MGLGLGQELLEGQELVAANVDLVAGLEAGGVDTVAGLDSEVDLVQRAEDLVDLADLRLVLEEDRGVEVGDFRVDRGADHLALGGVHEGAHFWREKKMERLVTWLFSSRQSFNASGRALELVECAYRAQSQVGRKTGIHPCRRRDLHRHGRL